MSHVIYTIDLKFKCNQASVFYLAILNQGWWASGHLFQVNLHRPSLGVPSCAMAGVSQFSSPHSSLSPCLAPPPLHALSLGLCWMLYPSFLHLFPGIIADNSKELAWAAAHCPRSINIKKKQSPLHTLSLLGRDPKADHWNSTPQSQVGL